jgi:transposase
VPELSKYNSSSPSEFRKQLVDPIRVVRRPASRAQKFEPTARSIRKWVAQGDRDEGRRSDGLTGAERVALSKSAGENRRRLPEREMLNRAEFRFARDSDASPKQAGWVSGFKMKRETGQQ